MSDRSKPHPTQSPDRAARRRPFRSTLGIGSAVWAPPALAWQYHTFAQGSPTPSEVADHPFTLDEATQGSLLISIQFDSARPQCAMFGGDPDLWRRQEGFRHEQSRPDGAVRGEEVSLSAGHRLPDALADGVVS